MHDTFQFASIPTIPMVNPFPLPQAGHVAFIINPEDINGSVLAGYRIMELPLEARQRWSIMGDLLRELSVPLDHWPAWSFFHQTARDDTAYSNILASLRHNIKVATRDNNKAGLEETESQLKNLLQARQDLDQLQMIWKKTDREERWAKIQALAQELIRDYYNYYQTKTEVKQTISGIPDDLTDHTTTTINTLIDHGQQQAKQFTANMAEEQTEQSIPTSVLANQALLPFVDQIPTVPAQQPRKGRGPIKTPPRTVARRTPYVFIRSDNVGFEIGRALQTRNHFHDYPDKAIARYIRNFAKERGEIVIDIGDGAEAWSTINDALNSLDDGVTDTYYAVTALGIECNSIQHICEPFLVSPDDILEICCKKKSNGSYTPVQRAEVIKNLKTLSLCKVRACVLIPQKGEKKGPGRPKRGENRQDGKTFIKMEGSLIDLLSFKIGEYSTITGEELWEKQSIAIGQWAKTTPGISPSTAIMLREVLHYSGKNERYQKRIGIYLTHMFRYNAKYGGKFPHGISIAILLERSGIVVTKTDRKNPGRFKDSVEHGRHAECCVTICSQQGNEETRRYHLVQGI